MTSGGAVIGANGRGIDARSYGAGVEVLTAAVTGSTDGIDTANLGVGATNITSNGTVIGTTGNGIRARNTGRSSTRLSISSAAVSGGNSGISADNYGTGAVVVTAAGAVTGTNGSGIYARNRYGTDLTISTAAVSGAQFGIYARNAGSGALSVTSADDVAGVYGAGIVARNTANGTGLSISSAGVFGATKGIYARGYGIGLLSVTSSAPVVAVLLNGISAQNTAQGRGVNVSFASVSGGYNGIDAQNYGREGAFDNRH